MAVPCSNSEQLPAFTPIHAVSTHAIRIRQSLKESHSTPREAVFNTGREADTLSASMPSFLSLGELLKDIYQLSSPQCGARLPGHPDRFAVFFTTHRLLTPEDSSSLRYDLINGHGPDGSKTEMRKKWRPFLRPHSSASCS